MNSRTHTHTQTPKPKYRPRQLTRTHAVMPRRGVVFLDLLCGAHTSFYARALSLSLTLQKWV